MIRLVAFDMDGVLTRHPSSWKFVHERLGVDNYTNLHRYRSGEILYSEFLNSDISLWTDMHPGITRSDVMTILRDLPVRSDLEDTISSIRRQGAIAVIISGGISWLSDIICETVEFDEKYANKVDTDNDGSIVPHGTVVVEPRNKDAVLRKVQEKYHILPEETASVGDSLYDSSMFRFSEKRVAFNSNSSELDRIADVSINTGRLADLYDYLFGN